MILNPFPGNSGQDCNFELGWCSYTTNSSARFKFLKHKGKTASYGTGPQYDHTLGNSSGTYAYAEASFPALTNDTTELTSSEMPAFGSPGKCISFWYHMYGPHVGTLNAIVKVSLFSLYLVILSISLEYTPEVLQGYKENVFIQLSHNKDWNDDSL